VVVYRIKPKLGDSDIKPLLKAAWASEDDFSYEPVLARSLTYVCAYDGDKLVGFVNVAWDGRVHAFLLDTTVHPAYQHQGIGTELVKQAAREAKRKGCHWLHVDYEAHLEGFYKGCGFTATKAGLIDLPKLPTS
jgi:GNAT superfamily N-acetyltransferase